MSEVLIGYLNENGTYFYHFLSRSLILGRRREVSLPTPDGRCSVSRWSPSSGVTVSSETLRFGSQKVLLPTPSSFRSFSFR